MIDYKVFWDYGEGGPHVEIASTTNNDRLFTQDADIIGGRTYSFTAVAVNAVDQSSQSEPLLVIAARVPTTPAAPTKKSADSTQITIEWVQPDTRGSDITQYHVYWNSGGTSETYTLLSSVGAQLTEY